MTHQTYQSILSYLEESGKIIISEEGGIMRAYEPERIRRLPNDWLAVK